jgi:hypothetical protein
MMDTQTPSERHRPRLVRLWMNAQNCWTWYAVYGDLIGSGTTPEEAFHNFDAAFSKNSGGAIPDLLTLKQIRNLVASQEAKSL